MFLCTAPNGPFVSQVAPKRKCALTRVTLKRALDPLGVLDRRSRRQVLEQTPD